MGDNRKGDATGVGEAGGNPAWTRFKREETHSRGCRGGDKKKIKSQDHRGLVGRFVGMAWSISLVLVWGRGGGGGGGGRGAGRWWGLLVIRVLGSQWPIGVLLSVSILILLSFLYRWYGRTSSA